MSHKPTIQHACLPGTDATDPTIPLISVVVIGRNEGKRLRRCLQSVAFSA